MKSWLKLCSLSINTADRADPAALSPPRIRGFSEDSRRADLPPPFTGGGKGAEMQTPTRLSHILQFLHLPNWRMHLKDRSWCRLDNLITITIIANILASPWTFYRPYNIWSRCYYTLRRHNQPQQPVRLFLSRAHEISSPVTDTGTNQIHK